MSRPQYGSADEFHAGHKWLSLAGLLMKRIVWIRPITISNMSTCTARPSTEPIRTG